MKREACRPYENANLLAPQAKTSEANSSISFLPLSLYVYSKERKGRNQGKANGKEIEGNLGRLSYAKRLTAANWPKDSRAAVTKIFA